MKKLVCALELVWSLTVWASGAELVAHYGFDDAENLGKDSSENGNNLSATSGFTMPAYNADGKFGGASYFDGSNGCVTPAGVYPQGSFTVAAWVKPADTNISAIIEPTSRKGGAAFFCAGGKLRFRTFKSDGTFTYKIGGDVTPGEWQHLAMTYDASSPDGKGDRTGTFKVYIDGVCVATTTAGCAAPTAIGMKLGSYSATGLFRGFLDDVLIYKGVLTESKIKALMVPGIRIP
jgi:hypothetical protein